MTVAGIPALAASSSPAASCRLLITAPIVASIFPPFTASITAAMLDPRPEIRMTSRFMPSSAASGERGRERGRASRDHGSRRARRTRHDGADGVGAFTRCAQPFDRCPGVVWRDDQDEADAAVEHAVHFAGLDVALLLQPVEYRRARPCAGVDARAEML